MKGARYANVIAFTAGFAAIAVVLSHTVPAVRPPQIGAKLDWLAEHGAEYDTVFIGSSRVHRQIIPDLFDREMEALGVKTNSFNLSGDGMRPPEDEFVLERAFASRKTPLRVLLVEANPIDSSLAEDDAGTARAVYWHDTARTLRIWRKCWSLPPALSVGSRISRTWKRLRQLPDHVQHWIWNSVRLGQGNEILREQIFGPEPQNDAKEVGDDGYRAPKTGEQMTGGTLRTYQKNLAAALKSPTPQDAEDPESQAAIGWKKALAERMGARLVLVSSPFLRPEIFRPASLDGITFLDYSDPSRYPELYTPENRRDPGHLNVRGSEIYTRLVARQIADSLKKQP
jgi:hypothetical protein